jgi:glycosyltransferase involved in cell wall biosynthesis
MDRLPQEPKLSVILCTYNRCQSLRKALDSLAISSIPDAVGWEVIVVDNNSSDCTREVIHDFCRQSPGRIHYLFEPQQGKSFALNRGISEARGEILAFMDDDVTVEPTWLNNLTDALRNDKWAGVGGRIVLEWPEPVPEWFATEGPFVRHAFPGFDQGQDTKDLVGPPLGTNMAFRKEVFKKHGGFRTDLGPNPGNEIRGEDTEFGRRVIAAGERLGYEPSAVVHHPVPGDRIDKHFLLKWRYDYGRGDAREFAVQPVRVFFRIVANSFRWFAAFDPRRRFHSKLIVWENAGKLVEFGRQTIHPVKRKESST